MSDKKKQFKWAYEGNKTKIFPIDYTKEEMGERISPDMTYKTFEKQILDSPVFRDILLRLLVSDEAEKFPDEFKSIHPLPLEAGLFFSELVKSVCRSPNETKCKDILNGEKGVLTDIEQKFVKQLFQRLCDTISDAGTTPEQGFYRHTLMSNTDFTESVMENLWENQLDKRVQRLKELARTAPPEIQAQVLVNCFYVLDFAAFQLYNGGKNTAKEKIPQQLMKDVLNELLSTRKKQESGTNIHAVYCIDNVPVGNTSLEAAFSQLMRNSSKELLKKARETYWENIATKCCIPQFETTYLNLRGYLDDSKAKITKTDLQCLIRRCCVEFSKVIIGSATQQQFPTNQHPFENKYLMHLINCVIYDAFIKSSKFFYDTYGLISTYTGMINLMETSTSISSLAAFVQIDCIIKGFDDYLKEGWRFFRDNGILNSNEENPFDNTVTSAAIFSESIKNAQDFFGISQFYKFEYTIEAIGQMLALHQKVNSTNKRDNLRDYFCNCQTPLLYGILLLILHKISMDVEKNLMEKLPLFIENREDSDDTE